MHNDIEINFTKISATGNDFIVIDNRRIGLSEKDAELFRQICRRRISIGADGVLLLNASSVGDFELRYFNADGSEAECGNGARAASLPPALSGGGHRPLQSQGAAEPHRAVRRQHSRLHADARDGKRT